MTIHKLKLNAAYYDDSAKEEETNMKGGEREWE